MRRGEDGKLRSLKVQ